MKNILRSIKCFALLKNFKLNFFITQSLKIIALKKVIIHDTQYFFTTFLGLN